MQLIRSSPAPQRGRPVGALEPGLAYNRTMDLAQRIVMDPQICHGRPCIRGTRIWVSLVLDRLAAGEQVPDLLREYPQLNEEDIRACIAYGAEMTREHVIPIPAAS